MKLPRRLGAERKRSSSRASTPRSSRSRRLVARLGLLASSILLVVLILELVGRLIVEPSETSAGRLFNLELPPQRLLATAPVERNPDEWFQNLVVGESKITVSDLFGFIREDPLLTYAPEENRRSTNGWWQSNNLGARRRQHTEPVPDPGKRRVLVFGDSFAHSSRVPQEDMFTRIMEDLDDRLEVINFGVDGYSMAQSYLRFGHVAEQIEFDIALLVLVPEIDLIRDVNTLRSLIGWDSSTIMPRFELEEDRLRLVPSPFRIGTEIYENKDRLTQDRLRRHLTAHDRFFQPALYEPSWLAPDLITVQTAQSAWYRLLDLRQKGAMLEPGSEATRVSKAISESMRRDAEALGGRFALVLLPTARSVEKSASGEIDRRSENWASFFCDGSVVCLDLSGSLFRLEEGVSDRGFDGTHFGPRTNRIIAETLLRDLFRVELLPAPSLSASSAIP